MKQQQASDRPAGRWPPPTSLIADARPKTSSERGRVFRERQRQRESELEAQAIQLRRDLRQLRGDLLAAKTKRQQRQQQRNHRFLHLPLASATAAVSTDACVELAREFFAVLRYGLDAFPSLSEEQAMAEQLGARAAADRLLATRYKASFLWRVLDKRVRFGNLTGVEAVVEQWRRHTAAHAAFEIEVQSVDAVAVASADREETVVVARSTLRARFSRESFPSMFPRALEQRPEFAAPLLDRDLTFECMTHFQFSDIGLIKLYAPEINFVQAFIDALGSISMVAELMEFSAMTQHATFKDQSDARSVGMYDEDDEELRQPGRHNRGSALPSFGARKRQEKCMPAVSDDDQEEKEAIAKRVLAAFHTLR